MSTYHCEYANLRLRARRQVATFKRSTNAIYKANTGTCQAPFVLLIRSHDPHDRNEEKEQRADTRIFTFVNAVRSTNHPQRHTESLASRCSRDVNVAISTASQPTSGRFFAPCLRRHHLNEKRDHRVSTGRDVSKFEHSEPFKRARFFLDWEPSACGAARDRNILSDRLPSPQYRAVGAARQSTL